MRTLKYYLELPDGSHQDEAAFDFVSAEKMIRAFNWPEALGTQTDQTLSPFMLFLDPEDSFFMIMPESLGLLVTSRVTDKWNLLGMMEKQKAYTLNFGLLDLDDTLRLLKLFYEDKYPNMRALEKIMAGNPKP